MHPLFPAIWMGSLRFLLGCSYLLPVKRNTGTPIHMAASSTAKLRLGKQEGLQNIEKGQVHSVATAAQKKAGKSVHENVIGYEDDYMKKNLDHTIEKTELFDCSQN